MTNQGKSKDKLENVERHEICHDFVLELVVQELDNNLNILRDKNILILSSQHFFQEFETYFFVDNPVCSDAFDVYCKGLPV